MIKQCAYCGKEFEKDRQHFKFCSAECRQKSYLRNHPPMKCEYCGKVFQPRNARNIYCSKKCSDRMQTQWRKKMIDDTEVKKVSKIKPAPVVPLAEMNARARAAGMTYGKYTAMMQKLKECD